MKYKMYRYIKSLVLIKNISIFFFTKKIKEKDETDLKLKSINFSTQKTLNILTLNMITCCIYNILLQF